MLSDNSLPNMMIQSKTNYHLSLINNHLAFGPSTTVEKALQIDPFMQNKANLLNAQMNVNKVLTKNYENIANWTLGENKPNTKPKQTQSNPTCRGVAPAASPPRRGEAGSKPIYVELTKTSKGVNSMFFNIIKEQSEEKDALLRVVSALDGMAEYCAWQRSRYWFYVSNLLCEGGYYETV